MHVARGDARHPQALGQAREPAVARHVVAPERALELDPEAVAPERAHQALAQRHRRAESAPLGMPAGALEDPGQRAVASAAGEADEALGALFEGRERQQGGEGIPALAVLRRTARVGVRFREEQAEVPPARGRLDQERQVERRVRGP